MGFKGLKLYRYIFVMAIQNAHGEDPEQTVRMTLSAVEDHIIKTYVYTRFFCFFFFFLYTACMYNITATTKCEYMMLSLLSFISKH